MIVLSTIIIGFMILSFPLGAYAFYNGGMGLEYSAQQFANIPVFILGIPLGIAGGISLMDAFAILWIVYLILFVIILNGPFVSMPSVIRRTMRGEMTILTLNSSFSMVIVFSSLYLVSFLIEIIQSSLGISTGALTLENPLVDFFSISLAPLTEEIGFRVSTIGLVGFALMFGRVGLIKALRMFWHPQRYLVAKSANTRQQDMRVLYSIALFTGIFFGISHLLFGGGWEIGKVTTGSLAGVALGVMYIQFGLPNAILLHWSFNYFRGAYFYFGDITSSNILGYIMEVSVLITGAGGILLLTLIFIARRIYGINETYSMNLINEGGIDA